MMVAGEQRNGLSVAERRAALIASMEEGRRRSIDRLRGIDDRAVVHPKTGWRVQDVLGHLAAWEREGLAALQAFVEQDDYDLGPDYELERFNQEAYARRRLHYADQCRVEWGMTRRDLQFVLREVADDRFEAMVPYPWGGSGDVASLIGELLDHEREHIDEIVTSLGGAD